MRKNEGQDWFSWRNTCTLGCLMKDAEDSISEHVEFKISCLVIVGLCLIYAKSLAIALIWWLETICLPTIATRYSINVVNVTVCLINTGLKLKWWKFRANLRDTVLIRWAWWVCSAELNAGEWSSKPGRGSMWRETMKPNFNHLNTAEDTLTCK